MGGATRNHRGRYLRGLAALGLIVAVVGASAAPGGAAIGDVVRGNATVDVNDGVRVGIRAKGIGPNDEASGTISFLGNRIPIFCLHVVDATTATIGFHVEDEDIFETLFDNPSGADTITEADGPAGQFSCSSPPTDGADTYPVIKGGWTIKPA